MTHMYSAPWHRASFDRFITERLPELLAQRLPLAGYQAAPGETTVDITVTVAEQAGDVAMTYTIPQPTHDGLFTQFEHPRLVIPTASSEDLATAEIRCVGEQLYDYIAAKLGEAPGGLHWDTHLLRQWLPLEDWVQSFLQTSEQRIDQGNPLVQWLDRTNMTASITHLRRLFIPSATHAFPATQLGRICPFEAPEGPNLARIRSIALGAEIRDGRLIISDESPIGTLGFTASMAPLLEHNDPARQKMGVNMMRQWLMPENPEPALVQTGLEPTDADLWCGYNLLTAYVTWGGETYEDSLLMSESCARRLQYAIPVEAGDKFSNRHGAKGVISRIVPDEEMPHLADGTPVELVYSFLSIISRLNFGQVREAVLGRIARAEGTPAIVPPYQAPAATELRARLQAAGLPAEGMEPLTLHGEPLPCPSTVGWVYWGRTEHISVRKIHASVDPQGLGQKLRELDFYTLRDLGACEMIRCLYNTQADGRPDAGTLAARVATGAIPQAPPPSPRFSEIAARLEVAGIRAELADGQVHFRFAAPRAALALAQPARHPWLHEREVTEVGICPSLPEYAALEEVNSRLQRLQEHGAPASLLARGVGELQRCVDELFAALLCESEEVFFQPMPMSLLQPTARVLFSGRSVIAPADTLHLDQVGLAEEIVWTLFSPQLTREIGEAAVAARTPEALRALDALLARSWVVMNRAPTLLPTALLAFHPLRVPDRTIRLHPLTCMLNNSDFDGDQMAVFLPLTDTAQAEAAEKLSVAAHLLRDPSLLRWLCPANEAMWGLAWLARQETGRRQISDVLGVPLPAELLTRAALTEILYSKLHAEDVAPLLLLIEQLYQIGIAAAKASGASINPFMGASFPVCPLPEGGDPATWQHALEECSEALLARADYENPDFGAQLLAIKAGARGQIRHLNILMRGRTVMLSQQERQVTIAHGLVGGVTPAETPALAIAAREGIWRSNVESIREAYGVHRPDLSGAFTPLARALRSEHPGVVFARAAAGEEMDPLTDVTSRLLVG